jgi:UDP:flavonoid glycosyltransferase YjiC (YdhE family)
MDPANGAEVIFAEVLAPHLAETHADLMAATDGADVVISHPASPASVIVAEERQLPWISSVLAPMSFFSAYDPISPPPAPWLQPLLANSLALSRGFLWLSERLTRRWAEPIQEFRASRGLPRTANPVLGGQHSPRLVLAMFSKVLASPQVDWPEKVCVTGASLYNGADSAELPADLEDFLDAGTPPVVFTLGTSAVASAGRFYETSAEVIDELNLRGVMLVGPHAVNRPASVSSRVHLAEYASHAALFARASLIVHQGGAGTLHQALVSGRPTLVVPHSHDQPDNARRVVRLGVARSIRPGAYSRARVSRELRALMSPPYAERAEAVAAIVRSENGPVTAAEAIERSVQR